VPDVTIDKDFRLALGTCGTALLLDQIPYIQFLLGAPLSLLGVLFLVQTFRLDFTFDKEDFELKQGEADTGENIVVGGANRWAYKTFVNYETFPKGWDIPILVYFKETQTPEDQWSIGPGESANSAEAIANGAVPGQVHFFPAICNAKQITAEFAKRGCKKL
jgi:NIMA (never in mitosis gene a)-related kinase